MASKIRPFRAIKAIFFTFLLVFSSKIYSQEDMVVEHNASTTEVSENQNVKPKSEGVDITKVALEHILDSHSWHLWGEHEQAVSMPLPVILKTNNGLVTFMSSAFHHDVHGTVVVEKNGERFVNFEEKIYYASETPNEHGQYLETNHNEKGEIEVANEAPLDFSITKNVTQLLLTAAILLLLFISIAKAYKTTGVTSAPTGKQSFFEPLITFVRDDIAKENIGRGSEKYVPYLLTVFFLILLNNALGLIPISANVTGNIAFTMVLAVVTLLVTNFGASGSYWKHIFMPKPAALWPILMPIELFGVFSKPFALMIRLFANIAGGHIVIISLVGLIFIFKSIYIAPVSIAFTLFIYILECLVALLQAYIFTLLTALFIGAAREDHSHHAEEGAEAH